MPRKKAEAPPPPETNLAVTRDEARARLIDRITKGKELHQRAINSLEDLEQARNDHGTWSRYNNELLKRLFTSGEIADEYSRFYGGVLRMDPSPQERIRQYREDVGDGIHRLESIVERLELFKEPAGSDSSAGAHAPSMNSGPKSRVFIVHGHDEAAKEAVARLVERLQLEAIILHEKPTGGRTIIEKLEYYAKADFAVVLLTPDDLGAAKSDVGQLRPRARQNVVLELGLFLGLLGRDHVCALYKGNVELPSDFAGVGYVAMDDHGAWKALLARELRAAGFAVDMNLAV